MKEESKRAMRLSGNPAPATGGRKAQKALGKKNKSSNKNGIQKGKGEQRSNRLK